MLSSVKNTFLGTPVVPEVQIICAISFSLVVATS